MHWHLPLPPDRCMRAKGCQDGASGIAHMEVPQWSGYAHVRLCLHGAPSWSGVIELVYPVAGSRCLGVVF